MAASSDRKIEANRRNAQKSSGPKSAEGKEKSRRNGWKHGMAAVVVVPGEETAALDRAIAGWSEQLGPENVAEESLVHQMAAADVRMRRCAQVNETSMEGDAVEAVRCWEAKRRHRVRRMAQDLKVDPVNVVADLESSSYGCDWLIRRWRRLDGSLRLGIGWGKHDFEEALRLRGYAQVLAPTAAGDPAAIRFWTLAMRASPTGFKPGEHFRPDPAIPEDWQEAMARLREFVAGQIERLEGLREETWEAVDGPEAEAVAAKALMDAGKDAQIRHRYYRDAQLAQQRAAKLLMKLRDRKRTGEGKDEGTRREVTGAAIVEAMCVQLEAQAKAEADAQGATAPRRTEPNEAADPTADQERKPNENQELRNEAPGDSAPVPRRTEPGFRADPAGPEGPGRRPEAPGMIRGSSPRGV